MANELSSSLSLADLIVRPHHTALCVEDFAAARDFFVNIIGMRIEGEMDHRDEANLGVVVGLPGADVRWAMLELMGYRVELFKFYNPVGRRQAIRQCDVGLTHICFEVYDVDAAYRRLENSEFNVVSRPMELRNGRSKPFYVLGPEGIVIEFLKLQP